LLLPDLEILIFAILQVLFQQLEPDCFVSSCLRGFEKFNPTVTVFRRIEGGSRPWTAQPESQASPHLRLACVAGVAGALVGGQRPKVEISKEVSVHLPLSATTDPDGKYKAASAPAVSISK
jgi:hypothetical protein